MVTIHGHLRDLHAIARWFHEQGAILELPRTTPHKLHQTLFPPLNDVELVRTFASPHTRLNIKIGTGNRALMMLMLDTGVRAPAEALITRCRGHEGNIRFKDRALDELRRSIQCIEELSEERRDHGGVSRTSGREQDGRMVPDLCGRRRSARTRLQIRSSRRHPHLGITPDARQETVPRAVPVCVMRSAYELRSNDSTGVSSSQRPVSSSTACTSGLARTM